MIIKNPISNFLNHRSDDIKVAYFFREDFDEAVKEIAPFFPKGFPNYFTQISIRNIIVNLIKHCPNVYFSGGFSIGI